MKLYTVVTNSGVKHEGLTSKDLAQFNPKSLAKIEEYDEQENFWL